MPNHKQIAHDIAYHNWNNNELQVGDDVEQVEDGYWVSAAIWVSADEVNQEIVEQQADHERINHA